MSKKKPGRPEVPTSFIRRERVSDLMRRENINQSELAARLGIPQQSVNRFMKSGKISEQRIKDIIEVFPDYRSEWLLGFDVPATHSEMHSIENSAIELNAPITVLYSAMHEVCARENMEEPDKIDIPEFLFLEAQLKDFAISLMWNYLKYRKNSSVWSYLDQVEEAKKRRDNNG